MWKREVKHKADEIVAVLKAMWYIAKEEAMLLSQRLGFKNDAV